MFTCQVMFFPNQTGYTKNMPRLKNTMQKKLKPVLGKHVKFLSLATNEELMIAKDTYEIITKGR